jgi:hypothetical protein
VTILHVPQLDYRGTRFFSLVHFSGNEITQYTEIGKPTEVGNWKNLVGFKVSTAQTV